MTTSYLIFIANHHNHNSQDHKETHYKLFFFPELMIEKLYPQHFA